MTDRSVVLGAVLVLAGGATPRHGSVALVVVGVLALALQAQRTQRERWWIAVALTLGLLASLRAGDRVSALEPIQAAAVDDTARLVTDPVWRFGALQVDVEVSGDRLEISARASPAARLGGALAGQVVWVRGQVTPRPAGAWWLAQRGVVGRLDVDSVGPVGPGSLWARAANGLRRHVESGASSMSPPLRSLYTGLVYGDDRSQSPWMTDDFRRSGLAHLLAVSGQNVAFVLLVAAPLLRRLGPATSAALAGVILVLFATVTRFEPSVLRAVAMAGLVVVAQLSGRVAPAARVLSLSVIALVLHDPGLATSLGFRLSVAATAGIVGLSGPIAARLPGPEPLASALATVLAAQLAVAPLVTGPFGGVPLAALPANLLAAPVAGLVMMWGCTAGLLAGVVGDPLATVVHVPTRVALWWIASVARWAAALPFGTLGLREIGVVAAAAVVVIRVRRLAIPVLAALAVAGAAVGVIAPSPPVGRHDLGRGAEAWVGSAGGVVVALSGAADPLAVLSELRDLGVRRVDVVVALTGGRRVAAVVAAMRSRLDVERVWAPRRHQVRGATVPEPSDYRIGDVSLAVLAVADARLDVSIGWPNAPPDRPESSR